MLIYSTVRSIFYFTSTLNWLCYPNMRVFFYQFNYNCDSDWVNYVTQVLLNCTYAASAFSISQQLDFYCNFSELFCFLQPIDLGCYDHHFLVCHLWSLSYSKNKYTFFSCSLYINRLNNFYTITKFCKKKL